MMVISKQLKHYRAQRKLTQLQLADVSKVSVQAIQRLESGGHGPTTATLDKLAKALGITPTTLLSGPSGATTTAANVNWLIVAKIAETLGISEREVLRAVCRGHLTGRMVGDKYLISDVSLNTWIDRGCPDLHSPKDVGEVSFDDGGLRYFGGDWASKVRGELEALIPDAPPADEVNEVRIAPTSGNIPKLLAAKTPVTSITDESIRRITRWCDAHLVPALRQHVVKILGEAKGQPHGMTRLFDPRFYATITSEAMGRLKRGSIAVTKYYPAAEAWQESRRVSFELSHADIIGNRGAELITQAF